jgi:hypothetical protein
MKSIDDGSDEQLNTTETIPYIFHTGMNIKKQKNKDEEKRTIFGVGLTIEYRHTVLL